MAAWFLMLVQPRNRHTASTSKLSVRASATVAGWSVSQNVSMPSLSSFSSMSWASGVNSGSDMVNPPQRPLPDEDVVDQPRRADAHGTEQQRRPLQRRGGLEGVGVDARDVIQDDARLGLDALAHLPDQGGRVAFAL